MIGKVSTLLAFTTALLASAAQADVVISEKPTQNMSCNVGVCTPTAAKAVLNIADLANMLASGDVTVNTGGSLAKDIEISAALSWASTSRLTLDAFQSVTVKKPVSVTGIGALTMTTNDGGSGGDLLFENKGNLTFWDLNSSLVINANSYTLVGDIATLAAGIAANPSGFYALANSYDAKHDRFDKVPVPTTFAGTFEGLGQSISHLKIKRDFKGREGLFAHIDFAGTVRDLTLVRQRVDRRRLGRDRSRSRCRRRLAGERRNLGKSQHLQGRYGRSLQLQQRNLHKRGHVSGQSDDE